MTAEISNKLGELHEAQCKLDALNAAKSVARKAAIPPEVAADLVAIDLEFAPMEELAIAQIDAMTAKVKAMVEIVGCTVKGGGLQAVYTAGKVSYDSKALDGLLIAIPELAAFRQVGKPSVSIRMAK